MRRAAGFLSAVGLLTRVPVSSSHLPASGVAWFPVVGGLIGLAAAAVYWLGYLVAPPLISSLAAVTLVILLTGALHEDGLADYADALGSGRTGEAALEVMADPRVGTFGALALVVSLIWRAAAISALEPDVAMVWLVIAHSLARSGTAVLAGMLSPARPAGLGRTISMDSRQGRLLAALGGVVVALAAGVWAAPAVLLAGGSVLVVRRSARRLIGGVTGDVLGACEQIIEMAILTLAAIVTAVLISPWNGLL